MTAEQLEELLAMLDNGNTLDPGRAMDELFALAPSLARRVLAADKLVVALDRVLCYSLCAADRRMINAALTAYREARK